MLLVLAAAVPAVQEQELPAVAQVRLLVQAQSAAAVVVVGSMFVAMGG